MRVLIIAFAARPGYGSEGGVGWSFILESAVTRPVGDDLHILIDARDEGEIRRALEAAGLASRLSLHAIPVPRFLGPRHVGGKTRLGYMGWRRGATRLIRRLGEFDVVHQVTFATGSLPPVRADFAARWVWGPIAVPTERSAAGYLGRLVARYWARKPDLVIATNDQSLGLLKTAGARNVRLEPNVFVQSRADVANREEHLLALCGVLEDRKRPWIAIQALSEASLKMYKLAVIGDGPLRPELEALAKDLGVSERVDFKGRLTRDETQRQLASARLLLHPSRREGACWVIGEAAAVGTPAVVYKESGAGSTVELSQNGGEVSDQPANGHSLAAAALRALSRPLPEPTDRWSSDRIKELINAWWMEESIQ